MTCPIPSCMEEMDEGKKTKKGTVYCCPECGTVVYNPDE